MPSQGESRMEREESGESRASDSSGVVAGLGRAFGGALIFALPMLMTMEMWWLGFYADRFRLALLLMLNFHLLVMLSRRAGFEATRRGTAGLRAGARVEETGVGE